MKLKLDSEARHRRPLRDLDLRYDAPRRHHALLAALCVI